eukprot:GHVR01175323.1.p1 GENE.GHVR01175323.1~~GHVR01175323.1.p1  ORF type:complete len:360 (-),score=71.50 GHVR01175323.1:988-2067(-)
MVITNHTPANSASIGPKHKVMKRTYSTSSLASNNSVDNNKTLSKNPISANKKYKVDPGTTTAPVRSARPNVPLPTPTQQGKPVVGPKVCTKHKGPDVSDGKYICKNSETVAKEEIICLRERQNMSIFEREKLSMDIMCVEEELKAARAETERINNMTEDMRHYIEDTTANNNLESSELGVCISEGHKQLQTQSESCKLWTTHAEEAHLRLVFKQSELDDKENVWEEFTRQHKEVSDGCTESVCVLRSLKKHEDELIRYTSSLQAAALKVEVARRKLHNEYQELRGNIRVFCRVRPLSPSEIHLPAIVFDICPKGERVALLEKAKSVDGLVERDKATCFCLDRVFTTTTTQATVFAEISQ